MSGGIILLSMNKTAILSLAVILVLLESKTLSAWLKKYARVGFSLIVGLTPLVILASMVLFSSPTRFPSLWSRVRIIQMIGLEMLEHPWRLLTGYGWGSYTDTFLANLARVPEAMYQNGVWNPTWDGLSHINSHSHHQVAEALLSTGIWGALIVLALPVIAVYMSDRTRLLPAFVVFFLYAATSSGWFEIPATLPFIALSYALFWPQVRRWNWTIRSAYPLTLFSLGAALCFVGGMTVFHTGIAYPGPTSLVTEAWGTSPPVPCEQATRFPGPGGMHLARHLRSLVDESAHYQYANKQIVEEVSQLVCATKTIKDPSLSMMVPLLTLTGDIARAERFPWVDPLRQDLLPQWRGMLEAVLDRAPYRTDLLVSYFRWRIQQKDRQEVWDWCQQILVKSPNDPIALWFKGTLLKETSRYNDKAYVFLNRALDAGVARLIPIDPVLEKQVRNYQPQDIKS